MPPTTMPPQQMSPSRRRGYAARDASALAAFSAAAAAAPAAAWSSAPAAAVSARASDAVAVRGPDVAALARAAQRRENLSMRARMFVALRRVRRGIRGRRRAVSEDGGEGWRAVEEDVCPEESGLRVEGLRSAGGVRRPLPRGVPMKVVRRRSFNDDDEMETLVREAVLEIESASETSFDSFVGLGREVKEAVPVSVAIPEKLAIPAVGHFRERVDRGSASPGSRMTASPASSESPTASAGDRLSNAASDLTDTSAGRWGSMRKERLGDRLGDRPCDRPCGNVGMADDDYISFSGGQASSMSRLFARNGSVRLERLFSDVEDDRSGAVAKDREGRKKRFYALDQLRSMLPGESKVGS